MYILFITTSKWFSLWLIFEIHTFSTENCIGGTIKVRRMITILDPRFVLGGGVMDTRIASQLVHCSFTVKNLHTDCCNFLFSIYALEWQRDTTGIQSHSSLWCIAPDTQISSCVAASVCALSWRNEKIKHSISLDLGRHPLFQSQMRTKNQLEPDSLSSNNL